VAEPEASTGQFGESAISFLSALRIRLRSVVSANLTPILIVMLIFLFALFVRSYFGYDMAASNDWLMSGGSDSYYYKRLVEHATETGEHLHWDSMLNFPNGARNPRPPLYTFSVAVPAVFSEGLFSIASDSSGFFLIWSTAFWGALTVIPTYLIARDLFGRKTGYIAALFLAILPTHVERSVATLSDHDPFVLFFIVLTIYFLMKAMKTANNSAWVENWLNFRSILPGLRAFATHNKIAITYSLLAGLSFTAIAIAWVGFAYVEVIILAFFIVQVLINKFKGIDSTTIVILFLIMFSFAFILTFPVYYQMLMFSVRFDIPVYLFFAAFIFGLLFVVTRDLPWLFVLPVLGGLISIAMIVIMIVDPALGEAIFTGQGYFIKSKLYETIAEARAPQFSELAISFGMVTFCLSFVGLFLMLSKIPKRVSGDFIIVSIWMTVAIFMAASAGRFMFNAAPAFALSGAWVAYLIVDKLDFKKVAKLFIGSSGTLFQVFRKSVKVRHVVGVLFLVFLLILPNVWFAIDAGIPMEKKGSLDAQIYDSMPSFMRPKDYPPSGGLWYLGAFGYSLPLPSYYFPAYWDWFSQQDSEILPESARPAYISWWDYGFEAISEGEHPTIADNFQQGYQIAGNILLSQSEEEAIGLIIARTVHSAVSSNGGKMPSDISETLVEHGASSSEVMDVIKNASNYRNTILENPTIYGYATSDISSINVMWRYLGIYFASLGMEEEVTLYSDLRTLVDYSIEYIGVDSRLIQKSARAGSVFYAPVKLTDRRIDAAGNPADYYVIKAIDDQGIEYDLYDKDVRNALIVDYKLIYKDAFFDTMIFRAFAGIAPSDMGKPNDGLPGYSGSAQSDPVLPGWNLTHFIMVYRTAYFNPSSDGSARWRAISLEEALEYKEKIDAGEMEGIVDLYPQSYYQAGAVMLKYYDGAILSGHIRDTQGDPAPGIRVTVLDEYKLPHQSILTDSQGYYSIILPPGDNTIIISVGELDMISLIGENIISEYQIAVSDDEAMRMPVDADNDGIPDWQIYRDEVVLSGEIEGRAYWDVNRDGNFTQGSDVLIGTGEIIARNLDNNLTYASNLEMGQYSLIVSPGHYEINTSINDVEAKVEFFALITSGSVLSRDFSRSPTTISGNITHENGARVEGAAVYINSESEGNPMDTAVIFTDPSGGYTFDYLLPGEYYISAETDILGAFGRSVLTTVSKPNRTADFVLRLTGELSLKVVDEEGSALKNASVRISNVYDSQESLLVVVDDTGSVTLNLPDGHYSLTVRIPNGIEILVGGTNVEIPRIGSTSALITVAPGTLVTGVVYAQTDSTSHVPEPEATIAFCSGPVAFFTSTNESGKFAVYVPEGEYDVAILSPTYDQLATEKVTVTSTMNISVMLEETANVSGIVWHDRNQNGYQDVDEFIPYAFIRVTLPDGVTLKTRANIDGNFYILLPENTAVTLTAEAIGYEISIPQTFVTGGSGSHIPRKIQLDLAPVSIEGIILIDDNTLPAVTIEFINGTRVTEFTSGAGGKFSGSLLPAVYEMKIINPVVAGGSEFYYANFMGVVFVGVDIPNFIVNVERRYKVEGNIYGISSHESVQIFFEGISASIESLEANESFEEYLAEGEYVCYAYDLATSQLATLFGFNLSSENLTVDIELVPAYTLSGQIQLGGQSGNFSTLEITDITTGANLDIQISPQGSYSVVLPSSSYELFFEMKYTETTRTHVRFLLLTNTTTLSVQSETEYNPHLRYGLDNSSLYISITDEWGNPIQTEVELSPMNEYAAGEEFESDENGMIESTIHPGTYAVIVVDESTDLSYFGFLGVGYNTPAYLNITLTPGYSVIVVTTAQNSTELDYLALDVGNSDTGAQHELEPVENQNSVSFIAPAGNYIIEASGNRFENDKFVEYSTIAQAEITSDTIINIPLGRLSKYSFTASWSSEQKQSIFPGESVSYSITIKNTGNIKDSYLLTGYADGFEFSFPAEPIEIDFGYFGNILTVPINITATATAKVVHEHISIGVASNGDPSISQSVEIEIDVLPVYSVETNPGQFGDIDGKSYFSMIEIANAGNAVDNYTYSIMNQEELFINGWNVSIGVSDMLSDRTDEIEPGNSESINITFTANRANPNSNITASIFVLSNSSSSAFALASAAISLPDLSFDPDEIEAVGDNVFMNDVFAEKSTENLLLIAILLALVAAIFIARKIKFGRFLR